MAQRRWPCAAPTKYSITCRSFRRSGSDWHVAVGPGRYEDGKLVPLDVRKGDKVLFGKWSGTEVKIDGEELLIMKESDILGIIEGKASVRAAA